MTQITNEPSSAHATIGDKSFPLSATDWVIVFRACLSRAPQKHTRTSADETAFAQERADTRKAWDDIISRLLGVGLRFQIQQWNNGKAGKPERLAIFVHCPDEILAREIYRSRVLDWLNESGSSALEPPKLPASTKSGGIELPQMSSAERLRLVYDLLTTPAYEGGAGLTMDESNVGKTGAVGGKYVEALFAPHDREIANKWVKTWAKKWFLTEHDLDTIRDYAGEKVAYYFAFLRFYLAWLVPLSIVGTCTYMWGNDFSPIYSIVTVIWSIVVTALWNQAAAYYSLRWGTRNYSKIEKVRSEFRPTKILVDPVTDERAPFYPEWKRWLFQGLVTLPITIAMIAVLGGIFSVIVSTEVFFKEFYDGPWKEYLGFVPTMIYGACIPMFHSYYTSLAHRLTNMENPVTDSQFASYFTKKLFFFNALAAFFALFAESFLIIPVSDALGTLFHSRGYISSLSFSIGPEALRHRLVYFITTGQVINAISELAVPMGTTKATSVMHGISKSKSARVQETPDEKYVRHVREEFERPEYDVEMDYSELAIQFGYVVLFSVAWPLAPLACLLNNFLELRADAFKICRATRRPVPQRADNIGPWFNIMKVMSWLSSVIASSLVSLYYKWDTTVPASQQCVGRFPTLVVTVIIAEHLYFLGRYLISEASKKLLGDKAEERRHRLSYDLKRRYLGMVGIDVGAGSMGGRVRWARDDNEEEVILYGLALKGINEVLKEE
ncbi:hypothetical protein HDU85_007107 [Gaertneriomyces sp. JEL0708]|nr:hypothetical protein HDU85_007107 [Gaertneriomyces sp. JEL0708]